MIICVKFSSGKSRFIKSMRVVVAGQWLFLMFWEAIESIPVRCRLLRCGRLGVKLVDRL